MTDGEREFGGGGPGLEDSLGLEDSVVGCAAPAGPGLVAAFAACCCAATLLVALWPEALHACPVCFDRDDEARLAFLATTGLLTLLPLGLVAGVGAWLRKRAGRKEEGRERVQDDGGR